MRLALKLHPDSVCAAVTGVDVDVARQHDGSLSLSYVVTGKIGDLRLPPVATPERADELWRSTCFEAFVRAAPGEAYYEFNFAPSTRWAAYRFDGYRAGMRTATEIAAPRIEVRSVPERYTLQATLDLSSVPRSGGEKGRGLRFGLSAVIEEINARKSYWALAHPPGKPDFHHANCFAHEFSPA
ncbi:MAG: DOMON-like domain-containing protein [Xanthobacteraceae bacterium]